MAWVFRLVPNRGDTALKDTRHNLSGGYQPNESGAITTLTKSLHLGERPLSAGLIGKRERLVRFPCGTSCSRQNAHPRGEMAGCFVIQTGPLFTQH
jgi:hypothetical protein